jgi:metallo-beta-lactamase family protein
VTATLTFLGAAGTVTGSQHLLEDGSRRILMDCGLFQGLKQLRERNWAPPRANAATLDAVLLSHAHIDHSGYLPRLSRAGFDGPVFCTGGTADLLRVMLPDAARLQEEEAEWNNRHGISKHDPALPLFTTEDADRVLARVKPVPFDTRFAPAPGAEARFINSGHILGAGLIECRIGGRLVVFSGDLGRYDVPIMRDPDPVPAADVLLVESTYGDRLHTPDDHQDKLAEAVNRARAARRLAPDPGVRRGTGAGSALRPARARARAACADLARLSRQSDGDPGDRDLRLAPRRTRL